MPWLPFSTICLLELNKNQIIPDLLFFGTFIVVFTRMRSGIFFSALLLLSAVGAQAQLVTTVPPPVSKEKLGLSDLSFKTDSSALSVVGASRSSKLISDLPITIHVVTREEIELNHYTSLADALKSLPGMRVSQPGIGELGETFQLRGLTGNLYTMILINGIPIKPSAVKGMPVMAQLPVQQAERIEIIYGPAAAVYGADAVSGVINIVTREADKGTFALADVSLGENRYRNSNFMVGGKAGRNENILKYSFYGSYTSQYDFHLRKGYEDVYNPLNYPQEKGITYNIGGTDYEPLEITEDLFNNDANEISSFIDQNYPANYSGTLNMPDMQNFPAESNLLGFNLRFRDFSFSFNNIYRKTHSALGQSSYFFKYDNPQNFWGENISQATLSYNHGWTERFSTTTNVSSLNYRMDNNTSTGITFSGYTDNVYRYSVSNDILFEQLFTVTPKPNIEILSGVTYQLSGNLPQTNYLDAPFNTTKYKAFSNVVDFSDPVSGDFGLNPMKYHNYSFFSQTYFSMDDLRFMGGLRFDQNSQYGFSFSPRLAALYKHSDRLSTRASVGFAYKAPPASLAWQSLAIKAGANLDSLLYIAVPNPDLEPENFMSVELGTIKTFGKRKRTIMNLSIFYNEMRNLIMEQMVLVSSRPDLPLAVSLTDTASVLTRSNLKDAKLRYYGLQATFQFNEIVKSINLNAELSLTFAEEDKSMPNITDIATEFITDFTLMPKHFGQLRVSMEPVRDKLFLNINTIWESDWLRLIIPFEDLYNQLFKDVDGFYSMDVSLTYRISPSLNSFIKVVNLFNEQYGGPAYSETNTPLPYNPQAGRTISFGLTYRLN